MRARVCGYSLGWTVRPPQIFFAEKAAAGNYYERDNLLGTWSELPPMSTILGARRLRFRSVPRLIALGMVLLPFAAGCGTRMGEVSGTVSYQGKALPSGSVTFFSKDNQVLGSSSIASGKYKVREVPPGPVKITVTTPSFAQSSHGEPLAHKDMPPPLESIPIPRKYGNVEQSGLFFEIKPGPQTHPIDLD
jgi:hypothetical protein